MICVIAIAGMRTETACATEPLEAFARASRLGRILHRPSCRPSPLPAPRQRRGDRTLHRPSPLRSRGTGPGREGRQRCAACGRLLLRGVNRDEKRAQGHPCGLLLRGVLRGARGPKNTLRVGGVPPPTRHVPLAPLSQEGSRRRHCLGHSEHSDWTRSPGPAPICWPQGGFDHPSHHGAGRSG